MKKKIFIIFFFIFFFKANLLNAQFSLYETETQTLVKSDQLCSNYSYTLVNDQKDPKDIIFLDENYNYFNDIYLNSEEINLTFPSNITVANILTFNVNENQKDYDSVINYTYGIKDCGYEKLVDDAPKVKLKSEIDYKDSVLNINVAQEEGYFLSYQTKDDKYLKKVDEEFELKAAEYPFIVQLEEKFNNKDGDQVVKYYELEIISEDKYMIRNVDNLQLRKIDISLSFLITNGIYLIICIFFYLYFSKKYKKYKIKQKRYIIKKRNIKRK